MRRFEYARPADLGSAIATLASANGAAKILAGGTTLFDLMKLDVETPAKIVDLNNLTELSSMNVSDGEFRFGAMVRMADAADDPDLRDAYPLLAEALWKAASQQLRNMASLGGNLLQRTRCSYFRHGAPFACNKRDPGSGCAAIEGINRSHAVLGGSDACVATYPGDFAVALVAMDAVVDLVGPAGRRTISVAELYREPGDRPDQDATLLTDEIITHIRVPDNPVGRASTYHKVRDRESYAFAVVSVAAAVRLENGVVADARIALGGVATVPWRVRDAEQTLIGKPLTAETALVAGRAAFAGAVPLRHNSFKLDLGPNVVRDALLIAAERA